MAKKVQIKLNSAGIQELLKSQAMADECMKAAQSVRSKVGDGYEVQQRNYPERTGAAVVAVSKEAIKDNLDNNTLLRALGS
ncbi:MAG: hypothetical protein IIY21_10355 [Clostridiales bacterium]|nr:hypothetical protein [Clostridiales bacterium]